MASASSFGVALLALGYRDLAAPADRIDDSTLASRATYDALCNPTDDAIFELLEHPQLILPALAELAEAEPTRTEALLHAFVPREDIAAAAWAEPFLARWETVERAIAVLVHLGVATRRSPRELVAELAVDPVMLDV